MAWASGIYGFILSLSWWSDRIDALVGLKANTILKKECDT
jgi:hypothetical protein